MKLVTAQAIHNKTVLLRLDMDVPIKNGVVIDDFRLKTAVPTLELCLEHAKTTIVMGHIGRPQGKMIPQLSVKPVTEWFEKQLDHLTLPSGKLHILENLRFEPGEESCDPSYVKELASLGEVFINESFAAYHKASSTTELPKLLPAYSGIHFFKEVTTLINIRQNPQKPLVFIIGGAKIVDKLPVVTEMAKIADAVLVAGKLPQEIKDKNLSLPKNALVATLNDKGSDITPQTSDSWVNILSNAQTIVWNGPLGYVEDPANDQTQKLAHRLLSINPSKTIIGGGDTIAAITQFGLINDFLARPEEQVFISSGGGAMLKLLETGTLLTIEALN